MCDAALVAEWSGGEAEAFGEAVQAALMARNLRQTDLAARLSEHLGRKITQANVSQWVTGEHEPKRAMVFAMEEVLDLKPGALSRVLGYLPLTARSITTVEEAIAADSAIAPEMRSVLLAAYREAAR